MKASEIERMAAEALEAAGLPAFSIRETDLDIGAEQERVIRKALDLPLPGTKPTCYICGLRPAALPLAYCLDCYAEARGTTDLVGVTEIAARIGTTPGTVHAWRRRHDDFPPPLAVLATGPIWSWPDVARWNERPRVRTGRPKKA